MPYRPDRTEYTDYFHCYVARVPVGDPFLLLESGAAAALAMLRTVELPRETHRYRPGAWSIREVVGHMLDVERLFAFRTLFIAREGVGDLPAMDPDRWNEHASYGDRPLHELIGEYESLRRANLALFRGLPDEAWARVGTCSGQPFTARAFLWILIGHELHHLDVLHERYGVSTPGAAATVIGVDTEST